MFINRIFTRVHKIKNTLNDKLMSSNVSRQFSSKCNVIYTPSKRYVSLTNWNKPSIEKLKLGDNIPQNFQLVYRSTMATYLFAAQISAAIGVACVIGFSIINAYTDADQFIINFTDVNIFNSVQTETQMIVFSIGFILINIAVMILISKFPVRIYYNPENKKFLGVLFGKVPKTKKLIEFNAGEVIQKPTNSILPWGEFQYKLKSGKNIIMLDHYFRRPEDLNIMLGYTKL